MTLLNGGLVMTQRTETKVWLGTVLKCTSHPAALSGLGLNVGGAPGVKTQMAVTHARTGPNRTVSRNVTQKGRLRHWAQSKAN